MVQCRNDRCGGGNSAIPAGRVWGGPASPPKRVAVMAPHKHRETRRRRGESGASQLLDHRLAGCSRDVGAHRRRVGARAVAAGPIPRPVQRGQVGPKPVPSSDGFWERHHGGGQRAPGGWEGAPQSGVRLLRVDGVGGQLVGSPLCPGLTSKSMFRWAPSSGRRSSASVPSTAHSASSSRSMIVEVPWSYSVTSWTR